MPTDLRKQWMNSVIITTKRENLRKKNQSELKNTISDMKNTLERINSRLEEAKEQMSNLEARVVETTQLEQLKEKRIF